MVSRAGARTAPLTPTARPRGSAQRAVRPPSSPPSPASNHRFRTPSSSQPLPREGRLGRAPHRPWPRPLSTPGAGIHRPGSLRRRGWTTARGRDSEEQGLQGGGRGPGVGGSGGAEAPIRGRPGWRGPRDPRSRGGKVAAAGPGGSSGRAGSHPGLGAPRARGGKLFVKFRKRSASGRASHRGAVERRAPRQPHSVPRASRARPRERKRRPRGERAPRQDPDQRCPPRPASGHPPAPADAAAGGSAPRAWVPFLAPGPAPARGPQYPS